MNGNEPEFAFEKVYTQIYLLNHVSQKSHLSDSYTISAILTEKILREELLQRIAHKLFNTKDLPVTWTIDDDMS